MAIGCYVMLPLMSVHRDQPSYIASTGSWLKKIINIFIFTEMASIESTHINEDKISNCEENVKENDDQIHIHKGETSRGIVCDTSKV